MNEDFKENEWFLWLEAGETGPICEAMEEIQRQNCQLQEEIERLKEIHCGGCKRGKIEGIK